MPGMHVYSVIRGLTTCGLILQGTEYPYKYVRLYAACMHTRTRDRTPVRPYAYGWAIAIAPI